MPTRCCGSRRCCGRRRPRRSWPRRSPSAGASPGATRAGSPRSPRRPCRRSRRPQRSAGGALYRIGTERYRDLIRLAAAEAPDDAALAAALAEAAAWRPRKLPLDGDDLLALGLAPGPRVGAILAAVEAWWLEQDFAPDRAACLAHAEALIEAARLA